MAEKKYIYAKAANGLTVRVPEDQFEAWEKRQEELRAGTRKPDPEMVKKLTELLEGK